MIWTGVIYGAPRTKKSHNRIVRAGGKLRVIPSSQHEAWFHAVYYQARALAPKMPFDMPLNCRATFYRDRAHGDAVGYYQALADLLERAFIVENDRLIVAWDGTRLAKDKANPRIEVVLEVAR